MLESTMSGESDRLMKDLDRVLKNRQNALTSSSYTEYLFDTLNPELVSDLQEKTKAPLMQSLGRLREIEIKLRDSLKSMEDNREAIKMAIGTPETNNLSSDLASNLDRLSKRLLRLDQDIIRTRRSLSKNQEFCIEMMSWLV